MTVGNPAFLRLNCFKDNVSNGSKADFSGNAYSRRTLLLARKPEED